MMDETCQMMCTSSNRSLQQASPESSTKLVAPVVAFRHLHSRHLHARSSMGYDMPIIDYRVAESCCCRDFTSSALARSTRGLQHVLRFVLLRYSILSWDKLPFALCTSFSLLLWTLGSIIILLPWALLVLPPLRSIITIIIIVI